MKCHGKVAMYCFYNWEVGARGEPFKLCEACARQQRVPLSCVLEKMADLAESEPCSGANT